MCVRYATQILSSSVANVITQYYPQDWQSTASLCHFMDRFFDCLNVRNQNEGKTKRKEFLKPFRDVNDPRFDWLKNDFLNFFLNWKENIKNRDGSFTENDREKMFISWQTYEGLMITVHSVIEAHNIY